MEVPHRRVARVVLHLRAVRPRPAQAAAVRVHHQVAHHPAHHPVPQVAARALPAVVPLRRVPHLQARAAAVQVRPRVAPRADLGIQTGRSSLR